MHKYAIALLFAGTALGQNTDRAFILKNSVGAASLKELVTTMRTVAQIYKVSVDEAASTLAMEGAPDQIALAEWLVPKMDVTAMSGAGPQEYRAPGNSDDIVMVYPLEHAASPVGVQEIITVIRTVAEIQRVYALTAPRLIVLRGDAGHVALARFLLAEADQAVQPRPSAVVHEFKMDDGKMGTAVAYGLMHADSPRAMQETISMLRTVGEIARIFMVTEPKLLAIRGSVGEVKLAEWLMISEMDTAAAATSGNEARVPGPKDDVVHVFYLPHATGVDSLVTGLRATAHISQIFVNSTPSAIVLRGTAEQVAAAGRMIESSDQARP